jgi:hypothetical protein
MLKSSETLFYPVRLKLPFSFQASALPSKSLFKTVSTRRV